MNMNWIEVTDPKQLPYDRTSILAQNDRGEIGVVYWNSHDWVYDIPYSMNWDMDEIVFRGKIARYIILD
jgi:hypothetical protein